MRNLQLISLAALVAIIFSGCGSVSSIVPTKPHTLAELTAYDKVIVMDLEDGTKSREPGKVKIASRNFADRIALQISTTKAFNNIDREQTQGKAIAIEGTITKYEEGNAIIRLLLGCIAGGSYFDADVIFKDNESGTQIATLKVGKCSWVLGGAIASGQTVETFMDEAAKKIAAELAKIKNPKQK